MNKQQCSFHYKYICIFICMKFCFKKNKFKHRMYKSILYLVVYIQMHSANFKVKIKCINCTCTMQHTALSTTVFLKDLVCYEHYWTIIMSNFAVNITVYTCTPKTARNEHSLAESEPNHKIRVPIIPNIYQHQQQILRFFSVIMRHEYQIFLSTSSRFGVFFSVATR